MISRVSSVALATVFAMIINVQVAAAQDPSQVGKKLRGIVSPNVIELWVIALLIGLVFFLLTRKFNQLAIFLVCMLLGGAIIRNPEGFGDMASRIGNTIF